MVGWLLVVVVCAWAKQHSMNVMMFVAAMLRVPMVMMTGVGIITMADGGRNDVADDDDCQVHTC